MTGVTERLLGSVAAEVFADVKMIISVDPDLVRVRIYTPDGKRLLADIGQSPTKARKTALLLLTGADRLDPRGALATGGTPAPAAIPTLVGERCGEALIPSDAWMTAHERR